jgi:hypothetical protein
LILRDQIKFTGISFKDAPDTVFAGYPANPKAGYRILDNNIFGKISNKFIKTASTIIHFCKH